MFDISLSNWNTTAELIPHKIMTTVKLMPSNVKCHLDICNGVVPNRHLQREVGHPRAANRGAMPITQLHLVSASIVHIQHQQLQPEHIPLSIRGSIIVPHLILHSGPSASRGSLI